MIDESPQLNRRAALRLTCRHCVAFATAGLILPSGSLAQDKAESDKALPERFTRPPVETDEGGLWALMDREETRLRRSPFGVRDAALVQYLQGLVCKLGGVHCPDARVYVMRTPVFNATMAPNGMMQVWTGLLLRMENEAQLAAVLGHELGHYLERHSVEQLRGMKDRAAIAQFMGLFGAVGALGSLGVMANAFAFSREHESRADRLGMRLMKQAGFDGKQAARVWDNLLGELKVTGGEEAGKRSQMMATHPAPANRRDDLLVLAGEANGRVGAEEFQAVMKPHRLHWLQDEIRRGQFEESLVLFERMLKILPTDAQVLFARGEVYRQRAGNGDTALALADLHSCSLAEGSPPEVWRSLGLIYKKQDQSVAAVDAFEKYLQRANNAADVELIKHYISELK